MTRWRAEAIPEISFSWIDDGRDWLGWHETLSPLFCSPFHEASCRPSELPKLRSWVSCFGLHPSYGVHLTDKNVALLQLQCKILISSSEVMLDTQRYLRLLSFHAVLLIITLWMCWNGTGESVFFQRAGSSNNEFAHPLFSSLVTPSKIFSIQSDYCCPLLSKTAVSAHCIEVTWFTTYHYSTSNHSN